MIIKDFLNYWNDGRIKIEYEDAGNRPILQINDVLGDSKIPEGLAKLIEEI